MPVLPDQVRVVGRLLPACFPLLCPLREQSVHKSNDFAATISILYPCLMTYLDLPSLVTAHPTDTASPSDSPPLTRATSNHVTPTGSRRTSHDFSSEALPAAAPPIPPKPQILPPSSSTNPFINRTKSHDPPSAPSQPTPPIPRSRSQQQPPLPPRKPVLPPPPPRHSSFTGSGAPPPSAPAASHAFTFWQNQLTPGGKPTHPNVLMQQSLQAGRIAQSLKKAEAKLEKERVMEVLKSSATKRTRSESPTKDLSSSTAGLALNGHAYSVSSGSASSSSASVDHRESRTTMPSVNRVPALPPRRHISPPLSSTGSARSFEQVAIASIPAKPRAKSPFVPDGARSPSKEPRCSPPPQHPDLALQPPPPTHPDRKPAPDNNSSDDSSPTSRVFRSKSMHYNSPPVPPPRRRRPESAQFGVFPPDRAPSPTHTERSLRSAASVISSPASIPGRGHNGTVSRHLSLSTHSNGSSRPRRADSSSLSRDGTSKEDSPLAGIRSTLLGLQPKLDAARYKAEAGLSRRGYVPHAQRSLFHDEGAERLVSEPSTITEDSTGGGASSIADSDEAGFGHDTPTAEEDDFGAQRWNGRGWDDHGRVRSSSEGRLKKGPVRPWEVERDEMKWPVGPDEGWKPL